jgi:hypothetical protein
MGSFVHRAFKALRWEKKEAMNLAPVPEEKEEVVSP